MWIRADPGSDHSNKNKYVDDKIFVFGGLFGGAGSAHFYAFLVRICTMKKKLSGSKIRIRIRNSDFKHDADAEESGTNPLKTLKRVGPTLRRRRGEWDQLSEDAEESGTNPLQTLRRVGPTLCRR